MSPSPTHPSLRPPPSLPTCFLPPVPVFHGAASLRVPAWLHFPGLHLLPDCLAGVRQSPAEGGRVLGDPELPPRLPCGVSWRPSLEPFPACCLLGFHLMDFLSPSHPSQPWPGLSRSSPHPFLLWTPSLVFSQFHVPSPFLRFLSTQPQVPFHDPTTPSNQSPFRTQLVPSKTVSSPPTPSVLHCIDSYSHFRPQAPAPFLSRPTRILPFLPLVPPCFSLPRLPPPTPPAWHAPSPFLLPSGPLK